MAKTLDYQHVRVSDLSVRRLTREEADSLDELPNDSDRFIANDCSGVCESISRFCEVQRPDIRSELENEPSRIDRLAKADRISKRRPNFDIVRLRRRLSRTFRLAIFGMTRGIRAVTEKDLRCSDVTKVIERCLLMATDPGDLVLDPTCGSGTTATVAEQWGRRWITIDTSRVALALARARIMGARYPFYLLADSRDGQLKEAEVTRTAPSSQPVHGNIRHGFVYERVPHITLKSIANNAEIDVIWDKWQAKLCTFFDNDRAQADPSHPPAVILLPNPES